MTLSPVSAAISPAGLPALPSLDDVLRELHARSFYAFFRDMWPEMEPGAPYIEAQHLRVICDHLQALYEGRIENLSIEIGPGYGKSLVSAVAFPAWVWGARKDPSHRFGHSTYADDLTTRDSERCRSLMRSDTYQRLYGSVFRLVREREDFLRNDKGGYRKALSVKGQATGYRFNTWLGDDLLNMADIVSDTKREPFKLHAKAISTRGQIGKPYRRVVIGQRLHEDDAGGYAREAGFTVLCLPTEYDPSRHCQTYDTAGTLFFGDWRSTRGELLFPTGFGPDRVAQAKRDLGPHYSAQHQQLPVPEDGGTIKAEYLRTYAQAEAPRFSHHFFSIDTNQGQNADNDKSALSIHGVHDTGISLVDGWTGRQRPVLFIQMLKDYARKYQPSVVVIEQKDWGKALSNLLEDDPEWCWRIERYTPIVGKDLRAHEASPFFFKGRYSMPAGTPLTEQAHGQLVVFPAAKSRDLADSIIQAVIYAQSTYTFEAGAWEYTGSSSLKNASARPHDGLSGPPDDIDDSTTDRYE